MNPIWLNTTIDYLGGIGHLKADVLRSECRVYTYGDLLSYYPFRYVDKTQFATISEANGDSPMQFKGKLVSLKQIGSPKSRKGRLVGMFKDETGTMELIWFKGIRWVSQQLRQGQTYIVYGKPSQFKGKWSISHPEMEQESVVAKSQLKLQPIYHTGEKLIRKGLNSAGFEKLIQKLIAQLDGNVVDPIPENIRQELNMVSKEVAIKNIHSPTTNEALHYAIQRMKFEELFLLQIELVNSKLASTKRIKGVIFETIGEDFTNFYNNHLPFELTGAQKRVLKEIRQDVRKGCHMNRLIQGDVGSGKTIVALLAALIAVGNGFQVAFMAPTEILARQHYASLKKMLKETNVRVEVWTGSTKTKERRELSEALESGDIDILIGTHALIEPKVKFKNIGMAIIDEQHRFGVAQRAKLWKKAAIPPHVLVMTATPIPRTLAMTLYGDLDVSVIDELPPGRKIIKTQWRTDSSRMKVFGFVEEELKKGRQVYMVYPLIEESEVMDYKDLMDGYESISRRFPLPDYSISIVHGKMKSENKDYEMNLFVTGKTQILVSTTVIEVGVDVPNASVMIIESAERFGLSQLHQLRGRVGRGGEQSYCILMSGDKLSKEAKTRLSTMVQTNDGFKIAEVDMNLRGPGDIMGTRQSGIMDLKLADLTKDQEILQQAREQAILLLEEDPKMELEANECLSQEISRIAKRKVNWAQIS